MIFLKCNQTRRQEAKFQFVKTKFLFPSKHTTTQNSEEFFWEKEIFEENLLNFRRYQKSPSNVQNLNKKKKTKRHTYERGLIWGRARREAVQQGKLIFEYFSEEANWKNPIIRNLKNAKIVQNFKKRKGERQAA